MGDDVGASHVESIHNAKHQLCVVRDTPRCRWEPTFSMTGEVNRQDSVMAREIVKHQPHALDRATPAMEEQHVLPYTSHFVAYFDAMHIKKVSPLIVRRPLRRHCFLCRLPRRANLFHAAAPSIVP